MEITIDLDEVGGEGTVAEQVVARAATLLVARVQSESELKAPEIADDEVRQLARQAAEPIITEAVSGPFQPTDHYGMQRGFGEPVTLRELIVAEAKKMLGEKSGNYGRDEGSVLTAEIRKEIQSAFSKELAEAVSEAKKEVLDALRDETSKALLRGIERTQARF